MPVAADHRDLQRVNFMTTAEHGDAMEFKHLRFFIILAEELHFGRAAMRLGIEQSVLSRKIRELEERIGVQLFQRNTRSTWLSEAGEAFLPDARRIAADFDQSCATVRVGASQALRLRIGIAEGFVGGPVSLLLDRLEQEAPPILTAIIERPLAELLRMLLLGSVDAIIAPEQAATADTLSLLAWSEPLMMLEPATLGGTGPASLSDLPLPLVLPDEFALPGFAAQLSAILPKRYRSTQSHFAHVATLYALVGTGRCVGILPQAMTISSERVRIRPIRSKKARMTFYLTVRRPDDAPAITTLRQLAEQGQIKAAPPKVAR